jgi:hypothetical protein
VGKQHCLCAVLALTAGVIPGPATVKASVPYTTVGDLYTQSFNSFPTNVTSNAALEPTPYTSGWQDDVDPAASPQTDISIPGWHLFHPLDPGDEDGFKTRVPSGPSAPPPSLTPSAR